MPAPNSTDKCFPSQDTDNPLPNREDANAAQPEQTTEHYVPWSREGLFVEGLEAVGLISIFLIVFIMFILVLALTMFYVFTGFFWKNNFDWGDPSQGESCFSWKYFMVYPFTTFRHPSFGSHYHSGIYFGSAIANQTNRFLKLQSSLASAFLDSFLGRTVRSYRLKGMGTIPSIRSE